MSSDSIGSRNGSTGSTGPIIDQQKFYSRNTVWSIVGLTAIFSLVVAFFG